MTCVLYTGSGSDGVFREVPMYGGAVLAVPLSFGDWCGSQELDRSDGVSAYRAYTSYCAAAAFTGVKLGGVGDEVGGFLGAGVREELAGQSAVDKSVAVEGQRGHRVDGHGGVARGAEGRGGVSCGSRPEFVGGSGVDACGGGSGRSGAGDGGSAVYGDATLGSEGLSGGVRAGRRNGNSGEGVSGNGNGGGGVVGGACGEGLAVSDVGPRTAANRLKRARAKERKVRKQAVQGRGSVRGAPTKDESVPEWRRGAGGNNGGAGKRGFFAESTPDMRHALRMSRGERLIAENDLKAFQARRRLELEKDKDVKALKKLNEAQLLRRTETNKVQIEKAYASLAASGNVPGVGGSVAGGGSVETIVSGSSGSYLTISPGSSVSMKEVHEMQKENLRLKKREEDLVRREKELIGKLKACGVDVPTVSSGSEKTSWTVDKYGDLHEKYRGDPTVPEGLVIDIDCRMRLDPDGKVEERVAKYYEEMSDQVSEIVMY